MKATKATKSKVLGIISLIFIIVGMLLMFTGFGIEAFKLNFSVDLKMYCIELGVLSMVLSMVPLTINK